MRDSDFDELVVRTFRWSTYLRSSHSSGRTCTW